MVVYKNLPPHGGSTTPPKADKIQGKHPKPHMYAVAVSTLYPNENPLVNVVISRNEG